MKRVLTFIFIMLLGAVFLIVPVNAHWEDTNNHPVLTTEWDEYRIPATQVVETYDTYFIVEFEIPIININDKVLVFNKYSVIEKWQHFAVNQSEIKFDYNGKPSVTKPIGYYINKHGMTESEKEDAYNRFFNSQFIFFTEDTTALKKITLTLWLDSEYFSKSPPNYLELDFYDDLVYLIPIDDLPALNSFNLKSMKLYFKDFATWTGIGNYEFDFTNIPSSYDYVIFNFGDNVSRNVTVEGGAETLYNVNTDFGCRIIDRSFLQIGMFFNNSFDNDEYYITVYDYNYIINLKDSLSRDILDSYNTGYSNGYDKGFNDGANDGFSQGYFSGYDTGYFDGASTNTDFSFGSLLTQVFVGLGSLLAIELLPGISIGAVIAVPIVFGIIAFIIGKRGGKDD